MFADEIARVFRRPRTAVILSLLALLPVVLGVVVKVAGGPRNGGGPPFFADITHNAVFLPAAALATMGTLVLPLAVAIVAGDAVAGDAANGSLRYLLLAGASRTRVLAAKGVAALVFAFVSAFVVALVGLVVGFVLFPHGALVTLSGQQVSVARGVADVLASALVVGASLVGVVAVGVAISAVTASPLTATAITLAIVIATEVIGAVPQLAVVRPVLLSTYWGAFVNFFRSPAYLVPVLKDLAEQAGWLVVWGVAAFSSFLNRDIVV
jgi:ABC-2 type transport system permease protein